MRYANGLVIRKITIHRFMSYCGKEPQSLELNGNFISIQGKTGSGKSTCIEALLYNFFNKSIRSHLIGINSVIEKGGFVEIVFEMSGHLYISKRGVTLKNDKYITLTEDGKELHGTPSEITQKILNIIGMSEPTFLTTTVLPQDEPSIADFKPKQRTDILKNIFRLNALTNAHDIIKERFSTIEKEVGMLTREKEIYSKQYQNPDLFIQQKNGKEQELIELARLVENQANALSEAETELSRLSKVRDQYLQTQQAISQNKSIIDREFRNQAGLKAPDMSIISQLQDQINRVEEAKTKIQEVREITKAIATLQNELRIYKQGISEAQNECDTNLQKYASLSASYEKTPEDVLSEMMIKVPKKDWDIPATLVELQKAFTPVIFAEFKNGFIVTRDEKMGALRGKIAEITEQMPTLEGYQSEREYQQIIDAGQRASTQIMNLQTQERNYTENLERVKSAIADATAKMNIAQTTLSNIAGDYQKYDNQQKIVREIRDQKHDLEIRLNSVRSEISNIDRNVQTNTAIGVKLQELEKQLGEKAIMFSALSELKKPIFDDFQVFSLDYYLNQLSVEASRLIMRMTAHRVPEVDEKGRPRKYTEILFQNKKGGIEIKVNGFEIKTFSGGEQTLISMAIRLAISIMLSKMGSASRTLFIDEGKIGSLDQEAREVYMNMLYEVRRFFDKIILITHIEGLTQKFNQFIEISMRKGHSEIIYKNTI